MNDTEERKRALAYHLQLKEEEIEDINQDTEDQFSIGNAEYLVLTDKEADEHAREDIERTLWAFQPSFILNHCSTYERMTSWEYDSAKEALEKIQGHFCEGVNELIRAMIEDIDEFVEDAICEDGRGHFISMYDGRENEEEINGKTYYIYRTN